MLKQLNYSAALYLRLSRDDDGTGDSGSIKTQRMILERYCEEQCLQIYETYIDDGYSGLNFDRPAFQRMLEDIRRGLVNMVLTKDLSRLGRDYLQTGHYTEIFFPQHNVRYVALNDGVDTLYDNNDIAPFKNILNDMYARDLSRKIKSAKRARAVQGAFIGSHPPYGYQQLENNCNALEINEETAPIVRNIFRLALTGIGAASIAKRLQDEQILTPAAYKVQHGERHFTHLFENAPPEKQYCWAYTTVHRILRDRVYLGHMISHKSQVDHYKTKQRSNIPLSDQIVVENTHTPLISQEDYDKVQLLFHSRHYPPKDDVGNLFQSLIYCDECGHRLSMATKVYKNQEIQFYRCMHHYRFPEKCSGTHFIRFSHVYQIVLSDIQRIGKLLTCHMDDFVEILSNTENTEKARFYEQESKLQKRSAVIDSIIGRLYEDFAGQRITTHNYSRLLVQYQSEQAEITTELCKLHTHTSEYGRAIEIDRFEKIIQNYLKIQKLTVPLLHELIQRILVGQRKNIDGTWDQEIQIQYRFAAKISELK